jgi:uncharacterized protein DUF5655
LAKRPLWRCPRCGRQFANANQWHSCLRMKVSQHLADKPPDLLRLYRRFAGMLRRTGTVRAHAQKTRIAFISRMSFAGCTFLKGRLRISFILRRPLDDPRIDRVEQFGPRTFGHWMDVRVLEDLDDEVQGWIDEAASVGRQEHLRPVGRRERKSAGA